MLFLSLPGEIRNAIYDQLMFPHHDHIRISGSTSHPKDLIAGPLNSPLLRVSRTIRKECLSRLLTTKRIEIHGIRPANVFLDHICSIVKANIADLVVVLELPLYGMEQRVAQIIKLLSDLLELKKIKKIKISVQSNWIIRHMFSSPHNDPSGFFAQSVKRTFDQSGYYVIKTTADCKVIFEREN